MGRFTEKWACIKKSECRFDSRGVSEFRPVSFRSVPCRTVWCHDYHLMLLPSKLKEEHPSMKVGWFLHTPFPSSEIYRMLPVREELLLSVLRADLAGLERRGSDAIRCDAIRRRPFFHSKPLTRTSTHACTRALVYYVFATGAPCLTRVRV